jgi:catechol-2,3-dioxygenase
VFTDAFELYLKRDFGAARDLFHSYLGFNAADSAAQMHYRACEQYVEHPPGEDWMAAKAMTTK